MPKFLDYHAKAPELPPEMVQAAIADINAGKADEFGVKPLNAFFSPSTGEAYCYTEAPSAEAVCKAHEAKGMALGLGDVERCRASSSFD